jgi:hypothetical protein
VEREARQPAQFFRQEKLHFLILGGSQQLRKYVSLVRIREKGSFLCRKLPFCFASFGLR